MNKYLEKIAALNWASKQFAGKVAQGLRDKPLSHINEVFNKTHAVVSPRLEGVLTREETSNIVSKLGSKANEVLGQGKVYPYEAVRAARAGARLARISANKLN